MHNERGRGKEGQGVREGGGRAGGREGGKRTRMESSFREAGSGKERERGRSHMYMQHAVAHAPPLMLTLLISSSINLMLASATTEKASLISNMEISSFVSSHNSSTLDMAATGAVGKSMGARAASAKPGGGRERGEGGGGGGEGRKE